MHVRTNSTPLPLSLQESTPTEETELTMGSQLDELHQLDEPDR